MIDMANFWSSMFGWSSGKTDKFMEYLSKQRSEIWGNKEPQWIDTNKPYDLYLEIPELRAVINRRATMMSSGVPKLVDSDGNEVENHWMLDLIKKPNATQSWGDVIYSLSVNDGLFNNSFAYCPARSFGVRNMIVPLPTNKIKVKGTGKLLKQMDIEGLIESFEFWYNNEEKEDIELKDMIYLNTPDGVNLINTASRIDTLKYPLSNIKASYKKRNVLLENLSALGILSAGKSDMGGALPMTPEEKEEIQRDWAKRSKDKIVLTEADVKWTPMSYPTKDLLLFEELTESKLAIIEAYELNPNIFVQSSKYENVKQGLKMTYQDTIIPETNEMYDTITHQIGLDAEGLRLVPDFSHLPVLQTDKREQSEIAINLVDSGVADTNEARSIVGLPPKEDQEKTIQTLNGAQVTSMVTVIERVAQGLIPKESAIAIIRVSFGLSEDQAKEIVDGVTPNTMTEND